MSRNASGKVHSIDNSEPQLETHSYVNLAMDSNLGHAELAEQPTRHHSR